MAIDTVWKRASATLSFPHALGVWPSGTVDRQAAAWVYMGIAAGALASPAYELFSATSEMMRTLAQLSLMLPTLNKDSEVTVTVAENSKI
jgi:hypothetical protein